MLSGLAPTLLERCSFPPPGTPIACAVSGGADSLALLALAVAAGCKATAYHVDHGLREGSSLEAELVAEAAERLSADFVSLAVVVEPGPNLEARARSARFAVLPAPVATGHTADDQVETVLLNLLRGAGLAGLAPMTDPVRHPIVGIRRVEAHALVTSLKLRVVEDPSNRSLALRRNRVRHELLPLCDEIAQRDVVSVVARQSALLARDEAFLEALASSVDPEDLTSLRAAPEPVQARALRRWLRGVLPEGQPPDAATLARVQAVASGARRACELPGGGRVERRRGRLVAMRASR